MPLSTIKILDFSTLLPGPLATRLLADMGASVVKIESPTKPDPVRTLPPFAQNVSVLHAFLNHAKRSLALDLKQSWAIEVVKKLVITHDVLVESFRPGVMKRLGLDYESLNNINPKLIYCSITGYGQTGPYSARAGHDCNYLALSGLMSYTGTRNTGPAPQGTQIADIAGGTYPATVAILTALFRREKIGVGQKIDISIADAALWLNILANPAYCALGTIPDYESSLLNGGGFYGYYKTKDSRYVSVGCLEPHFWKNFCHAIERPELETLNPNFGENTKHLQKEISHVFSQKTLSEWQKIFENQDACVEPVLTLKEAFEHPHFKAHHIQSAFAMRPVATLGAHNEEILQECNYSAS